MGFWRTSEDEHCDQPEVATRILFRCCESEQPAKVLFDDGAVNVRFKSISNKEVILTLNEPAERAFFTPCVLCFVSFTIGERSGAFVGKIRDFANRSVVLEVPQHISLTEGRSAFRVPVIEASNLAIRVDTKDSKGFKARAIDLSFTGALIELVDISHVEIEVGSTVNLELCHADESFQIEGLVRRTDEGRRFGIFFPSSISGGQVKPPDCLRKLVTDLERAWIKVRRNLSDK